MKRRATIGRSRAGESGKGASTREVWPGDTTRHVASCDGLALDKNKIQIIANNYSCTSFPRQRQRQRQTAACFTPTRTLLQKPSFFNAMADASTSKKRKSDASTSGAKKARTGAASSPGQALVDAILANPTAYPVPDDADATRQALVDLATYARSLEGGGGAGASKPAPKTKEQIEEAAEKVRKAARSGIRKQMTVSLDWVHAAARCVYVCLPTRLFFSGSLRAKQAALDGYTTAYATTRRCLARCSAWAVLPRSR